MKNKIEQFKTIVKSEISDIDIGYKEFEDGYIQIYYYSKIDKKILFEVLGEALKVVFYNNGIFDVGLRRISKERVKEYFSEKNNDLNQQIKLQNVKSKLHIVARKLNKEFVVLNYTNNVYSKIKLRKYSKTNKATHNKPNIDYRDFI